VKIIQNIIPAMQKGNRIVIMDGVMPELGEAPNSIVKLNTSLDLQMMAALNAKERTRKDWTDLIGSADPRLTVKAFKQPPGSAASLIEVVFEG
jgi:6-hydroxytryprostatin B O-methyltransferase